MNRKYLSYAIFFAIIALVVGLTINHSRYIRSQIDAMTGPNRSARISAAKELVRTEQFSDTVTGETEATRASVIQALEDWASEPAPPVVPVPVKAADSKTTDAPEVTKTLKPSDAVTQILNLLKDQDKGVRDRALLGVLRTCALSDDNLDVVIGGIKDTDGNVRKPCVLTLQTIGQKDPDGISRLLLQETVTLMRMPDNKSAAEALFASRKGVVVQHIVTKLVAAIKTDAAYRGPVGDVLSALTTDHQQAVTELLPLLMDKDDGIKGGAADALGKMQAKEAITQISALLSGSDSARKSAISSLALIADVTCEKPLIEAVNNPTDNTEARQQAAVGLGKIATPEAVSALIKTLGDYDLKIRESAVVGLSRAGISAITALNSALKSPERETRLQAAQAMTGIAAPQINSGLIAALNDNDLGVARQAAVGLGFKDNSGAVSALAARLGTSRQAADASDALALIGVPARTALIKALSSSDPTEAYFASLALGKQGESAVPAIKTAANSGPSRKWAIAALGKIGGKDAVVILTSLRAQSDPATRDAATQALKLIGIN